MNTWTRNLKGSSVTFRYVLGMVLIIMLAVSCSPRKTPAEVTNPLKDYVMAGDDAYRYSLVDSVIGDSWKEYHIKMVSGTWLTEDDVDAVEWWHWLTIIIPDHIIEDESMMIIGGGSAQDSVSLQVDDWLIRAAVATGSIISHVSNIPFQPIDFKGDEKDGRYEDDLIAYGWRQYLESGASVNKQEWLARFPMTRAVVRAMDVVQEISMLEEKPVNGFFVTGASKRGWTTWTTAAVDERVIGIAPIVIDLLNIIPSFEHHWRCYGEWSPAVDDYVQEGIMNWMGSEEFSNLLSIVGPYSYIDNLTMPKLLINATCDEFFVTDSWQFYWDDLKDSKYLQYVPNGNHGLKGSYQPSSLISFYNTVITEAAFPQFSWSISGDTILIQVDPGADYIIHKWEAVNDSARDFRIYVVGEAWQKEELIKQEDGKYAIHFAQAENGYKAGLVEIIFKPDSDFPLTFTSGTLVTPDKYPFPQLHHENPQGTRKELK